MLIEDKIKAFRVEIDYLKDDKIKLASEVLIGLLPDYFFSVAASSTGKYHPSFSLGDGGLLRHTKCATRIAKELLDIEMFNTKLGDKRDIILLSIMLHDGLKHGLDTNYSEYTTYDHPITMANYIESNKDKIINYLSEEDIILLKDCIKTHMGEWTKDYKGIEILEKPQTKYQKFVHMCDYLSGRKFLDVKFDNQGNIFNG